MNTKIFLTGFILFILGTIGFYFIYRGANFNVKELILMFVGAVVILISIRLYIDKILRKFEKK